jgi:hypothetical protein
MKALIMGPELVFTARKRATNPAFKNAVSGIAKNVRANQKPEKVMNKTQPGSILLSPLCRYNDESWGYSTFE